MMLKVGIRTNTITTFILEPPSCSFFEEQILSNQCNSTLRLSDSHVRGQQTTQTNGGCNQRRTARTNPPRNNDTHRLQLQIDTGWLCFSKPNAGSARLPRLGNGTNLCKSLPLLAIPVPTTARIATEDITSNAETS